MSMIKCPECGHNVSTMAGTCPNCGVSIDGNLHKCPECGGYYLTSQQQCPSCGCQFNKPQAPVQQPVEKEAVNVQQQPKKPKKKSNTLPLFFSIIIILGLFVAAYYYFDYQGRQKKEETAYEQLTQTTNPEFYQQFLLDYPNSKHFAEVEERMQQLQNEDGEWEKTLQSGSRMNLVRFLQDHPDSYHARECNDRIDSIDWAEALKAGNDEAIDKYLADHPEGLHAEEAADRKNELAKAKISDEDKSLIRGALEGFFNSALAKEDAASLSSYIPEKMNKFNGQADATPDQILQFTAQKKAADVLGIHYVIGTDLNIRRETLSDATMGFAMDFTLEETLSRSDATQATSHSYHASALMNAEKQIVQMSIK